MLSPFVDKALPITSGNDNQPTKAYYRANHGSRQLSHVQAGLGHHQDGVQPVDEALVIVRHRAAGPVVDIPGVNLGLSLRNGEEATPRPSRLLRQNLVSYSLRSQPPICTLNTPGPK